jgi:hypothetical protein
MTEAKEASFESIISIFRYLKSKDIFETFYTKYLAERLLHRKSESQEKEQAFVQLIKVECGHSFFTRVEQMYKDMSISEDLQTQFSQGDPRKRKSVIFETEFFVLSQGAWPV